jgi:hypothetical protein
MPDPVFPSGFGDPRSVWVYEDEQTDPSAYKDIDVGQDIPAEFGRPYLVFSKNVSPAYRDVRDSMPTLAALPDVTFEAGQTIAPIDAGAESGGTNLVFGLSGPAWLSIDPDTGIITGDAPDETLSLSVTVSATNRANTASRTFQVTLEQVALPVPAQWTDTLPGIEVETGGAIAVTTASLAIGDLPRTYGLVGPSWLSIDPDTGLITGTAPATPIATSATVTVSNALGLDSTSLSMEITNASGSNPCVAAVIGQSENVVGWLHNSNFYTSGAYPDVAAGVDMEVMIPAAANDGVGTYGIYEVTQAHADARDISPGAVAIGNLWHLGSGGAPLRLVGACVSGTGMGDLLSDASTSRSFADEKAMVDAAESVWGSVERVMYNWYVAEAGASQDLWNQRSAHFFGINPDGSDFDFAAGAIDHCIIDTRSEKTGGDLGLFGPNTKVDVMYPGNASGNQGDIDPPWNNYMYFADGSPLPIGERHWRNGPLAFAERRNFIDRTPANNRGVATVSPGLTIMGDFEGGGKKSGFSEAATHPALQSKYGQILYSQDVAFALLCAYGQAQPTRLNRVEMEETGAYADFIFDLPVGATLTTHRIVDNLTVVNPRPHQQEVMGFVIRRSGDTAATERPLFRTDLATSGSDLTNYPVAYRGTAVIHDAVAGVVRVTPEEPFENGEIISFGHEGSYAVFNLHGYRDYDAQMCLDALRAYEARLDDGTAYKYPGGPVVNQEIYTVSGLAGGNPDPIDPVAERDGTPAYLRGPAVGADVTAITMVFEGQIGNTGNAGYKSIMSVSGSALHLAAEARSNQRVARLTMRDGSGTTLVNSTGLGGNSISAAGETMRAMVTATLDDGAGNWRAAYYLNDGLVGSEFTGTVTASPTFGSTSIYEMLNTWFTPIGVGRVVVWAGDHADAFSSDGVFPTGTPLVTLDGDAAYWNGTGLPEGWTASGTGAWTDV